MPSPLLSRPLPLMVALGLSLAACGTPQEQCVNRATHDLRVVDGLIGGLKADIARGYGYETQDITVTRWVPCGRRHWRRYHRTGSHHHHSHHAGAAPDMCLRDFTRTTRRPVAIDTAEAKRTLAQLTRKRRQLDREARPRIAACKAAYPE